MYLKHQKANDRTWKLVYISYTHNYTKVDGKSWLIVILWAQPSKYSNITNHRDCALINREQGAHFAGILWHLKQELSGLQLTSNQAIEFIVQKGDDTSL